MTRAPRNCELDLLARVRPNGAAALTQNREILSLKLTVLFWEATHIPTGRPSTYVDGIERYQLRERETRRVSFQNVDGSQSRLRYNVV